MCPQGTESQVTEMAVTVLLAPLLGFPFLFLNSILPVVGRPRTPKDIHSLVPRTCEYTTANSVRDFADLLKVKESELERLSWVI